MVTFMRAAPAAHFGRIDARRRNDGLVEGGHASISAVHFKKKRTNYKVLPLYPFVHASIYLYLVAVARIRRKKKQKNKNAKHTRAVFKVFFRTKKAK